MTVQTDPRPVVLVTGISGFVGQGLAPKVERGFHIACADLMLTKKFVIYPGGKRYRLASDIEVISLKGLATMLAEPVEMWRDLS